MSELQPIDTTNTQPIGLDGGSGGTAQTDAASILANNDTGNGTHDLAGIGRDLGRLAEQDPARADQARAQIEQQLPASERGNLPQHVRVERSLPDGSTMAFDPNGLEQTRWIEQARTTTDPTMQSQYAQLVQIAGGSERTDDLLAAFDKVFRGEATLTAQTSTQPLPGADGDSWTEWAAAGIDKLNPLNPLLDMAQPAIADLGRQAGLGNSEWGSHLQAVLDSPEGFAAFRQGVTQGMLEGGQDFVVGIAELAGKTAQYGADNSPLGDLGDGIRSLTGPLSGALNEILPSSQRGDESNAALGRMAEAIGNYATSRAGQPELIGQDIAKGIDRVWASVENDWKEAAAKGPEAEARFFGQLTGRVLFEVASTFVPIAGQVRKVDAVADGARVLDEVADLSRGADELADAAKGADGLADAAKVDDVADAARIAARVENGRLILDGNVGRTFSVDGATGRIGDAPTTFRNAEGKPFARDVDGEAVQLNQPATYDSKVVNADGSVTYTKKGETVTYDAAGLPVFRDVKAEIHLGPDAIKSRDSAAHFREANRMLNEALQADAGLAERMGLSEAQLSAITKAANTDRSPAGFTWHHHQDTGLLQLVRRTEHNALPGGHTGGMRLWGGGRSS